MPFHQVTKAVHVERLAAFFGEFLCELDREAVGRDEGEGIVGRNGVLTGEVLEYLHPPGERLREALLFGTNHALDVVCVLAQQRVGVTHLLDDERRQSIDAVEADALALVDRTSQQAAADVAAAFVRRLDALGDEEADGSRVIRENAVGARRDLTVVVPDARLLLDPVHDQPEAIGIEHGADVLEHARSALDAVSCSTFGVGSGTRTLPGWRSYAMKTRL